MGDNISSAALPHPTFAPLHDGVPSLDETESQPSLLEKYAMMNEENKSLKQANANLKSALHDKTVEWIQVSTKLNETLEGMKNVTEVELKLRNKINELTEERDSSRRSYSHAVTALRDLKVSMDTPEIKADKQRTIPMGATGSIPTNYGRNIPSDHQTFSENSPVPVPAVAAATPELETKKEDTKKEDTKKDAPNQQQQRVEQSWSEQMEDWTVTVDQSNMNDRKHKVESLGVPIPEHKTAVQSQVFNFQGKDETEFGDDERTNYHIIMRKLEEEITSLTKTISKLKSTHGTELKRIKDQLKWCRDDYVKWEARANYNINYWKQGYETVNKMLYASHNETRTVKDILTKCSTDFWDTMRKFNAALERELKLREELEVVTKQRDKAKWDHVMSMVTLHNSTTAGVNNETNLEQNVAAVPIDKVYPILANFPEENMLSVNHKENLSTNWPVTTEIENFNAVVINQNMDERTKQGVEKSLSEECLMDMDDWELVNLCGMGDNNIQRESPVVVASIPEHKVEEQSEIEKTDENQQQPIEKILDKNNEEFTTEDTRPFDFKSDENVAVVEACLQYAYSSEINYKELKTKVANIFLQPFGTGLARLRELQDSCDNAVLVGLTVENILKSCNYGEKTKSDKILDACVVLIKKEKKQIWKNQQHDFIKAYQELPTLMNKLAQK